MHLILWKQKQKKYIMKKNLFLFFALAIAFASCKKDDAVITSSNNDNAQRSIINPLRFTKKVLVEEFTGCSYGDVPYSNYMLNTLAANNSNRVYVAALHINDVMQTNQSIILANSFGNGSQINFPCAMIDRAGNTGTRLLNWQQYNGHIQQSLAQTAVCGLAISSRVSNSYATVEVSTKFGAITNGDYNVSVYLIHESINSSLSNYGQANNFNSMSGSPFFGKGNPILPYNHQHVVFRILNSQNGGKVNSLAQIAGGIDMQKFSFDITPNNMGNDCYVIAFITNAATREVVNVQQVKLGLNKTWD